MSDKRVSIRPVFSRAVPFFSQCRSVPTIVIGCLFLFTRNMDKEALTFVRKILNFQFPAYISYRGAVLLHDMHANNTI
jgi:hypothetical protein